MRLSGSSERKKGGCGGWFRLEEECDFLAQRLGRERFRMLLKRPLGRPRLNRTNRTDGTHET
jgi:hypothetical protein